jgi:hypothetical protein
MISLYVPFIMAGQVVLTAKQCVMSLLYYFDMLILVHLDSSFGRGQLINN